MAPVRPAAWPELKHTPFLGPRMRLARAWLGHQDGCSIWWEGQSEGGRGEVRLRRIAARLHGRRAAIRLIAARLHGRRAAIRLIAARLHGRCSHVQPCCAPCGVEKGESWVVVEKEAATAKQRR
eukprot:1802161-Pleurochrysis_carterae.AAC.1